jgi:hypothetical protein
MADERESVAPVGRELADTVLDAFTRHRLVGIGESHGPQNHHDALQLRLADPRLPEVIDDIVVEFGNALPGHDGPVHRRPAGRRRRSARDLAEHHAITPADLGRAGLRAVRRARPTEQPVLCSGTSKVSPATRWRDRSVAATRRICRGGEASSSADRRCARVAVPSLPAGRERSGRATGRCC